ncbi:MAG: ABC transporter substrate-binding protein [Gammaproteobacteria bacterium]|nr:MAG: ABC transporter substrate-binding protein [Gammaproteobacteria bacterium]
MWLAMVIPVFGQAAWNNPYPASDDGQNILYSAFAERPKKLDPARSYSSNEYIFIANIYEPPFQYHYLKRPYTLTPLTAVAVPKPVYYDKRDRQLPEDAASSDIAYSVYTIRIRDDIQYQPHPSFARNEAGDWRYHRLSPAEIASLHNLEPLTQTATRTLRAADYVYQIKRLADSRLHSPIFSLMSEYIIGLKELAKSISDARKQTAKDAYLDLNAFELAGAKVLDDVTYQIRIHGKYPQFLYWMAMPFFAPMPFEADRFFSQPGLFEQNITLDWYAVGTGPYMLTVNDPNRKMVLQRNPNFHREVYPDEGEAGDAGRGLLVDAGKELPFIDKVIFSLEKEGIPYWNKFLQGYYDRSGISAESFDQAVRFTATGDTDLTADMKDNGIRLQTSVAASSLYFGFNMLDPVVGGHSERARKLRQAISITIDFEEQISIFRNGRGIVAQGPIPPGIFGFKEGKAGMNPVVYDWREDGPVRKSIAVARQLLSEAGYKNGINPKTGKPLLLYFESTGTGPEDKARLDWMRKQFDKLNIQLVIRATDYNRFQDKMRTGHAQMFTWGWNADYPDPENFMFLLYGPNKKVGNNGENAANYDNPEFNRLFEQMKDMDNSPERQRIIDRMVAIVRHDAPWAWGYHPKQFSLEHSWLYNSKPNLMANNTLKYYRLDANLRTSKREQWNRPVLWPVIVALFLLAAIAVPAISLYRRHELQVRG